MTVDFGKLNTLGQTKQTIFETASAARAAAEKAYSEKLRKGYVNAHESVEIVNQTVKACKPGQTAWQRELAAIYAMSKKAEEPSSRILAINHEKLLGYVREGDIRKLKKELDSLLNLEPLPDSGFALLSAAKNEQIVEYLLSKGASVVSDDGHAIFSLIDGCAAGRSELSALIKLCEYEGNLFYLNNIWDDDGCYPIHSAVATNNLEVIRTLVEAGADLALRSNEGESPIGFAAKRRDSTLVRHLVALGSPVRRKDFYLNPACEWSKSERKQIPDCYPIEEYLLTLGSNTSRRTKPPST